MIITRKEIPTLNLEGKVVGVTSGCFDLFHFYHLRYLERCKALCDFLIVGVDSDLLVYDNKHKFPVIPEHHRMEIVNSLKCVGATFRMDSVEDITKFYGVSNKVFKNNSVIYGKDVLLEPHIELIIIPDIEEVYSTTGLISKIKNG